MLSIITLVSIKGGVAKTLTSMNLAGALRRKDLKVLLIDADFQGNLTDATIKNFNKIDYTMFDLISNEKLLISECIYETNIPNVDIVPSDLKLMQANRILDPESSPMAVFALRNKIDQQAKNEYDFIIIDTHPDINIMTTNALTTATEYMIPVFTDRHLINAVKMTTDYVDKARQANKKLSELGILIGNYDGRKKISGLMLEKAKKFYGDRLMNTIIHTNTALEKGILQGKTIFQHDLREKGCKYFRSLADEIIEKIAASEEGIKNE